LFLLLPQCVQNVFPKHYISNLRSKTFKTKEISLLRPCNFTPTHEIFPLLSTLYVCTHAIHGARMPEIRPSQLTCHTLPALTWPDNRLPLPCSNHLTILGCCVLVSPGQYMKMTFVDFSRDMFFYALAIALFVWFFIDGHVTMQESW
jgi:hypothetical protein